MTGLLSKAVKNSVWTGIGSLGTTIVSFFFAGLTIRFLGESEAGFAIAVSTIAGINGTFSGLGIGTAATRIISKAYDEENIQLVKKVTSVCFSVSLAFGIFGFCLFAFGSPAIVKWAKYQGNYTIAIFYCILMGAFFLFSQISSYFTGFLASVQRFDWQTKISIFFGLSNGVLGIILLKYYPNLLTVGLLNTFVSLANVFLSGYAFWSVFKFLPRLAWDTELFLELWSFGKWVYLTQITGLFLWGLDKVFLISVFGSTLLPIYTFPQRIYQTVHEVLVGQSSYLFPMLSAQGENCETVATRIEDRLRWIIGVIAALIYANLIIWSKTILSIIVSPEFAEKAYLQLIIFSLVGYLHAHTIVPFFLALSKGDAKGNWIYHVISGVANLSFLMLFATLFGFKYASLGQLAIAIGTIYLSKRLRRDLKTIDFIFWLLNPWYSSLGIIFLACICWFARNTIDSLTYSIVAVLSFYLTAIGCIIIVEKILPNGKLRLETLQRTFDIFKDKFKLSKFKS